MRAGRGYGIALVALLSAFAACTSFSSGDTPGAATSTPEAGSPPGDGSAPDDAAAIDADAAAASAYRSAVLADGPIAYWRMDIAKGSIVPAETGNGHDLALAGKFDLGVNGATADKDDAIRFDGFTAAGSVDKPRDFDFVKGASFTIECWTKRQDLDGGSSFRHIFSAASLSGSLREGYAFYEVMSGDAIQFEIDFSDAGAALSTPLASAGQWTHYAAVFDGTTMLVYVDGALKATKSVVGNIGARTSAVTVGSRSFDASGYYAGSLDEIAVYAKALSAVQIVQHIDAAKQ